MRKALLKLFIIGLLTGIALVAILPPLTLRMGLEIPASFRFLWMGGLFFDLLSLISKLKGRSGIPIVGWLFYLACCSLFQRSVFGLNRINDANWTFLCVGKVGEFVLLSGFHFLLNFRAAVGRNRQIDG